jgi:glucose-6-phosphate 1-dehydrogenase
MNYNPLKYGLVSQRIHKPFTFVIFGASGDLTRVKIIPALFSLFKAGYFTDMKIVGFARRPWTDDEFRSHVIDMISQLPGIVSNDPDIGRFTERVFYISSDFDAPAGYSQIAERFAEPRNRVFYLATPPSYNKAIIAQLEKASLSRESSGFARVIAEKPFGDDLESARELNHVLLASFAESQVFRIDHYLGKEAVQNLFVLRFANSLFEPVWNCEFIDHVQITVAEKVGIGTRGNIYESLGALKDVIQNHVLQLLSVVAMEQPRSLKSDDVRDEKLAVLKALLPFTGERLETDVALGQYTSGIIDGETVAGYRDEDNTSESSDIETYAALTAFIDTPRWEGVPFFLRTGKRLAKKLTEISIRFKPPATNLFSEWLLPPDAANTLTIRVQPDEGVFALFNSKVPGFSQSLSPVKMNFSYGSSFGAALPEAYERLLLDAIAGDSTLYMRNDEIEAAWHFTDSLVSALQREKKRIISFYTSGSQGPEEAKKLTSAYGARWRKL